MVATFFVMLVLTMVVVVAVVVTVVIIATSAVMSVGTTLGGNGSARRRADARADDGPVTAAHLGPHRRADGAADGTADNGINRLIASKNKTGRKGQGENCETSTHLHASALVAKKVGVC